MKPYGKQGKQINCCPAHDSTSKPRGGRAVKKTARQQARQELLQAAIEFENGNIDER